MSAKTSPARRATKLAIISGLTITLVLVLVTLAGGRVTGVEFAPSHFSQREFYFWELPLLHLQISPIYRTPRSTGSITFIRSQKFINVPTNPPTRYDIVAMTRGAVGSTSLGDAEILVSYLDLKDRSGGFYWEQWSRDNPAAAAVFWPIIHQLANDDLYLLMPDLFAIADHTTDPNALADALNGNLQKAYLDLAQDLKDAGKPTLAADLLRDAKASYPKEKAYDELLESLTGQP